ncbi:homoserine dehydrogenase [Anaerosporobacter faecicola]|uniref:homoserine dehydrogenase n=1 Tax=Anaerosporobacter faecicola TaxID=2718714 RepID=UPI00143AD34A|nr:homoserine dehydrogenase [Anaerosporobacter faecicola]
MRIYSVAFLGFGVVGSKVYEILQENHETWMDKYGIDVQVRKVLVHNKKKPRSVLIDSKYLTENIDDLVYDPQIQICFECMGGNGVLLTKSYILQLLKNGKDIIMASKKCLSLYRNEILSVANTYRRTIHFEATVGGGIPIIQSIQNSSYGEQIHKVYGILNATSNYILSKMTSDNMSYQMALELAKKAGYTENNSTEDVDGLDAAYKLTLLVQETMGRSISINQVRRVSIRSITPDMIMEAKKCHEVFKQIASASLESNGELKISVEPKRISEDSILNCVNDTYNIICTEGTRSGLRAFYGQGAGDNPTATVMIDDLLSIIQK